MGSYYRRFVKDFASKVRPMSELTKKDKKFKWDDKCQQSFEELKRELISPEIMGYQMNDGGEFRLDVNAIDLGIGAVLHLLQGDRERVIAYASRALNKAEKNNCITEKELLAIRFLLNISGSIYLADIS